MALDPTNGFLPCRREAIPTWGWQQRSGHCRDVAQSQWIQGAEHPSLLPTLCSVATTACPVPRPSGHSNILAPAPHTGMCLPALPASCTAHLPPLPDQNLEDLLHDPISPFSLCQQHRSAFLKAPPLPALRLLPDSGGKEGRCSWEMTSPPRGDSAAGYSSGGQMARSRMRIPGDLGMLKGLSLTEH